MPQDLTRRCFSLGAASVAAGCLASRAGAAEWFATAAGPQTQTVRVNAERLRAHLERLSEFGRPAGGTFADGVSRTAYSDADVAGRNYVMQLIRDAGLAPQIDAAGNIFALRAPSGARGLALLFFGSALDFLQNGGELCRGE